MSPSEFRQIAHQHADWIAEYFEQVRDFPVLPDTRPGDLLKQLPAQGPEQGEPIEEIFAEFRNEVFPRLTRWNHPRFFGYYPSSATPPSVLADFLASAVNANAMLWKSAPAATELEQLTLSWLRQWLGIDEQFFGLIYDTASVSTFQALGAAREWADPESRTKGMRPGLIVYITEHSHSSCEKAAIALGFGQENVRKIPVDDQFRMRTDLLEKRIQDDLAAGKRPCCVVASVGTTAVSAMDPVPAIAEIVERYNLWLHVDAAYAGSSAILPEKRYILDGVERAHSLVINPHKWLYVSVDCSILYTRHPDVLRRSSSLGAEYLRTAEDDSVVNFMDYGIQLGRRFRALKLWYVFRYYGREGIIRMLRESIRLAKVVESLVRSDDDFEVCAPVNFGLVCLRHRAGDVFNQRLLAEINATGRAFLSHAVVNGKYILRFSIGNFMTAETDVRETWALIQSTAARIPVESAMEPVAVSK
jgi:aromatic-L-amino-acid decarboxylase